ncbi:MAG: N-acetyl-gamma-glutamyl-phosphate reductase [Verrucomicrobia bacterium]|nr:N-acetyl-gamma-glutamyl-phosphate reductase [Verrucomicrobiota bacterium]
MPIVPRKKVTIAVIGGSSITGGEVCRLLLNHPVVRNIIPVSRSEEHFERVHPNLRGSNLTFRKIDELLSRSSVPDILFFCTPSGEAMKYVPTFLERGARVIDLSSDFRFKKAADYEGVYGLRHTASQLLDQTVSGITEFFRKEIASAHLVANAGCYVIASVLGIIPLLKTDLVDPDALIHICAINGTTGAGSSLKKDLHHAYAFGSMLPYNLNGHRHRLEIEQRLNELSGKNPTVDLTTIHGNFARGIIIIATIPLSKSMIQKMGRQDLCAIYNHFYKNGKKKEHFIQINDAPSTAKESNAKEYDIYPSLARVVGSNFCHIGFDYEKERNVVKVVSVIDNLVKGAAGSAIQNMNVMLGIKEQEGLLTYGL